MSNRRNGWTPQRQARFIGLLAQTGCVRTAARMLGLSRESAYRLRRHPQAGSFIAAWNTALLALLADLDRQTAGSAVDPFGDGQVSALFGHFW